MRWFPIFLDLRNRRVVVVGGGGIAERKIDLLLEAKPNLTVIAPSLTARLRARVDAGEITHEPREFQATDLDGARLVLAATDAPLVNRAVAEAAEVRGIPANIVDNAELSTGILPAIVDRSPLIIAIGTEGSAPALARYVRARIEALLDESLGALAGFLARWRARIKTAVTDLDTRRRLYDRLIHGEVADLIKRAREPEADEALAALLANTGKEGSTPGVVQIVGAGPGDPGLLTLNALRALQGADVVLHDRLVSPEILRLIRREAEVIEVGKSAGRHSVTQDEIHALLLAHATRGRRVVRLKGGDPFVFGRGGEEAEFLKSHQIAFEIVPGVTAALACGAYAGIPLTHREHSASLRLLTAHSAAAIDAVDWQGLSDQRETLAIYMAVATLERLQRELMARGRSKDTPIAFIENGSRPNQRVVLGTLASAHRVANEHRVQSPALLIVGSVTSLAPQLHWFGSAPR